MTPRLHWRPGPRCCATDILVASLLLGLVGCHKLAPFVPTPIPVAHRMLELAEVTKDDVVYDLGSGDGRIVIAAARKYGAKAIGIEIDPHLVQRSRQAALRAEVDHLVRIRQQDLLKADFSDATVVTLYLGPNANLRLRPILQRQLKPGARIVSNDFAMEGWQPEVEEEIYDEGVLYTLYLWRVSGP